MKTIKELRESKKLSQEALAIILGLSRVTINKWENDRVKPRLYPETMLRLLTVLDIDLKTLVKLLKEN